MSKEVKYRLNMSIKTNNACYSNINALKLYINVNKKTMYVP